MTTYKIGQIYRIIHIHSNISYIGSTFNKRLNDRMSRHKNKSNNTCIGKYLKKYGADNFKIILIKKYEVCDRKHLFAMEQLWINKFNCININQTIDWFNGRCAHNKFKARCKTCIGASICEHLRMRITCKECRGSGICQHNKRRTRCKKCKGSAICEHNSLRFQCVSCKGSSICKHLRRRSTCIPCEGSAICEHKTEKKRCKKCFPNKFWCLICDKQYAGDGNLKRHNKKHYI